MSENIDWIMNKKWSANKVCADEFNALVSTSQKVVTQLRKDLAAAKKAKCRPECAYREKITELQADLATAEKRNKQCICMFCKKVMPRPEDNEATAEMLVDHAYKCEKHPIKRFEAKIQALKAANTAVKEENKALKLTLDTFKIERELMKSVKADLTRLKDFLKAKMYIAKVSADNENYLVSISIKEIKQALKDNK